MSHVRCELLTACFFSTVSDPVNITQSKPQCTQSHIYGCQMIALQPIPNQSPFHTFNPSIDLAPPIIHRYDDPRRANQEHLRSLPCDPCSALKSPGQYDPQIRSRRMSHPIQVCSFHYALQNISYYLCIFNTHVQQYKL